MMTRRWREFDISEYTDDDFVGVSEIFHEAFIAAYPDLPRRFHQSARFKNIIKKSTLPSCDVITAKAGSELAGFVALAPNFVDQLYIKPVFQGRGLGSYWIAEAKSKYPLLLELYTLASNQRAITFYEKHGFEVIERGIAADEGVPDVKMRWPTHDLIDPRS